MYAMESFLTEWKERERLSNILRVPIQNILFGPFSPYISDKPKTNIFVVPFRWNNEDNQRIAHQKMERLGVNLMQPLSIKCSQNKTLEVSYTRGTTISELKETITHNYKVPKKMQVIFYKGIKLFLELDHQNIVDMLLKKATDEIDYEFSFAVYPSPEVSRVCIENDFTILKKIIIRLNNGAILAVININSVRYIDDIYDYILGNLYQGKFDLYKKNSMEPINRKKLLLSLFMDGANIFHEDCNLIFRPFNNTNNTISWKDKKFLKFYQDNSPQKIRLVFITKEELIQTEHCLNVKGLKNRIKQDFGYAIYQQTLFHNNRLLENGEILTELSINEFNQTLLDTAEELIVNVIVSKARRVEVQVKITLPKQISQFMLDVEDNISGQNLRKIIEDRIEQMGSYRMSISGNRDNRLLDDLDMLCDISSNTLTVKVEKFLQIKIDDCIEHIHIFFIPTSTDGEFQTSTTQTVQTMINEYGQNKGSQFKLDSTRNDSTVKGQTLVDSLDSGTTIYIKEAKIEKKTCIML